MLGLQGRAVGWRAVILDALWGHGLWAWLCRGAVGLGRCGLWERGLWSCLHRGAVGQGEGGCGPLSAGQGQGCGAGLWGRAVGQGCGAGPWLTHPAGGLMFRLDSVAGRVARLAPGTQLARAAGRRGCCLRLGWTHVPDSGGTPPNAQGCSRTSHLAWGLLKGCCCWHQGRGRQWHSAPHDCTSPSPHQHLQPLLSWPQPGVSIWPSPSLMSLPAPSLSPRTFMTIHVPVPHLHHSLQGSQVSIYLSGQGHRQVEGYPKALQDELGVPVADAAFTCPGSTELYVIAGDRMRRVDLTQTPRHAGELLQLPHDGVDGAMCTADGIFLFRWGQLLPVPQRGRAAGGTPACPPQEHCRSTSSTARSDRGPSCCPRMQ
uniref:Uncharacterized protein n=1 Tax=Anas platyrhynchos TaxID=8839 RepID=A0A8B9T1C1_ANAPL